MEDSQQDLRVPLCVMDGKQTLVDILRGEGVEYVFGIPGATEIQFMDALESAPEIRYMLGLQEVVCVGMAEGYARASGQPGFLNLHTATGLAAATPMLYNAQLGHVPLVVTVGQNDTRLLQRDPHLTGDIVGTGKIYAKWSTELVHAQDLPVVMRRAFKMATQPPEGPVVVSIPQDVLQQPLDPAPDTYRSSGCGEASRPRADREAVGQAVDMLLGARDPLLLVESGVARSDAVEEVVRLAELVGARVYQGWMSDVNFPVSHPQYLGDLDPTESAAGPVLAETDVLVGIGCSLFSHGFVAGESRLPAGLRLIHLDDDPWEMNKNLPTDCCLLGDIKATLTELNEALASLQSAEARSAVSDRIQAVSTQKREATAAWERLLDSSPETSPVSIPVLMRGLRDAAEHHTVLVD